MDIHVMQGVTAEAVANAHSADVAVQEKYGVNYMKYWLNESAGKVFCLCSAPSAEAADRVHREAHGLAAERIIEVDPDLADGFLGGGMVAPTGLVMLPQPQQRSDPGQRTLVFTDIVGSTALTQKLGDAAAMAIVDLHDRIVRDALAKTGGREVKHLGDGIMAVFVAAEDAMRCSARIQAELAEHAAKLPEQTVQVRIGAASGEPVERNGDFFGSTVQLAARLCAKAQPGQTLVSTSVTELCQGKAVRFESVGDVTLKGFSEPVPAHALAALDG
jgi:class 3 adenylate cyclase